MSQKTSKDKTDAPKVADLTEQELAELDEEGVYNPTDADLEAKAEKKSRFHALRDEALKDYVAAEPYPFDADPDNIIWITKPDSTERALALASIIDNVGNIDMDQIAPMLESLCGHDAFPYVWAVIRDLPVEVTVGLILDIQDFFFSDVDVDEVTKLPGGTRGSSR